MRGRAAEAGAGRGAVRLALLAAAFAGVAARTPAALPAQETPPPPWTRGTTCYEIFVRSFQDSDGDGIGDFRGLTSRLDHVNDGDPAGGRDLGARCVWLMPFMVSPSYHGYDVADYRRVDPAYGTNEDFRAFMVEARRRGIRVLVDLVVNHTSSEHPWFRSAVQGLGGPFRDWYLWRDAQGPGDEFGGNGWRRSPVGDEWFYGFFWHTMPDLDWENEAVRDEMVDIARFWLEEMGVDGLRLDAVRHLMEAPDGHASNVPRTHDMLREFGGRIRALRPDAFTVGEVFDSTDVLRAYYPDQLDAYFAFQAADGILDAVRSRSAEPFLQAYGALEAAIPDQRYAPFLRNHDQRRAMTELEGDVAGAKLAATLLLTAPGIPFVYYGEEIGMTGDKPDPRIRTPMHWEAGPAAGFTTGVPWEPLQADSLTANVGAQTEDPASLLSHYRRLVHLRAGEGALGEGAWRPLDAGTEAVAAYLRVAGGEAVLVVANLGAAAERVVLAGSSGLPPGRYRVEEAFGGRVVVTLEVEAGGRVEGWTPGEEVPAREARVYRVRAGPGARTRRDHF